MKTYLMTSYFYELIEANSPQEAWNKLIIKGIEITTFFCDKKELQKELIKRGFKTMKPTNIGKVFLLKK